MPMPRCSRDAFTPGDPFFQARKSWCGTRARRARPTVTRCAAAARGAARLRPSRCAADPVVQAGSAGPPTVGAFTAGGPPPNDDA